MLLYFFPNECPGPLPGQLGKNNKVAQNDKQTKNIWVVVLQKHGKF